MSAVIDIDGDLDAARKPAGGAQQGARCRTNSRRGLTDLAGSSYPPVEAACRVLEVLRAVNKVRIASVHGIYEETGIPKSTVVRMLETLMAEGYVARDNMCGGYRVTHNVAELAAGYDRVSRVIEVARPFAIDLTRRIKWPIGLSVPDGDEELAIQFWTGTISPWAHTNTVLGLRPEYYSSAMGRAYMAFCSNEERERRMKVIRRKHKLDEAEERNFHSVLERAREDGYVIRDPKTPPFRTTTIGLPVRVGDDIPAVISVSYFRTAMRPRDVHEKVLEPVWGMIRKIEAALAFMDGDALPVDGDNLAMGF